LRDFQCAGATKLSGAAVGRQIATANGGGNVSPVKVAILSRGPALYSTSRLKEAALARGHQVRVLNPLRFSILVEQGKPALYYKKRRLSRYDAVVPRIGASITFFGTAVVRQFEQMGVFTMNSSHAISVSRDKLRSLQVLSRHNIGLAPTAFVRDKDGVFKAIQQVGGAPVIIKVLEGTQGVGVILADDTKIAQAIVETLQWARQNVLIQKFVEESRGRDVRAFVVGDRVVAAMRRVAQGDEYRANVHRGAHAERADLTVEYERTAIHAAQILGLSVAGVDMLETHAGPKILEVNSSPGLEGIEEATGVDVAGAIVDHLADRVAFPEVDVRQRLTLKSGYGVVEVPINSESRLARKKLRDAGLRAHEVTVLSVFRGSLIMPNPGGDYEILPGDRLLCYGKLMTIRSLIPAAKPRKRKKSNGVVDEGPAPVQPHDSSPSLKPTPT
jgi:ribosomal protein S6--L-glutamate ligase